MKVKKTREEKMEELMAQMKPIAQEIKEKMFRNESTIILRAKFRKLQNEHFKLYKQGGKFL